MTYAQSISDQYDQPLNLPPLITTVRSAKPRGEWEGLSVRSYWHVGPIPTPVGEFLVLPGQNVAARLPPVPAGDATPSLPQPPSIAPAVADWLKTFDDFVSSLPLVDYAVDASRENIY